MFDFKTRTFIYFLTYICINSCAQENSIKIDSFNAIEEDGNFYDALRVRSDLNFTSNKRILYTTIKNLEDFQKKLSRF